MGRKRAQSKYYGGDKLGENDEESSKLFLKDCHQRQASLYSIHPCSHSSVAFLMNPLSKGELLYSSGQSRFSLNVREGATCSLNKTIDFIIFEKPVTNSCKVPEFPASLDEEAVAFRSHGFPLVVWPRSRDKVSVQKYLDENYPDCGLWFRELDKCQTWLNEKWIPLSLYLGLATSANSCHPSAVLLDLPTDSIAATFIKERVNWLSTYCELLRSYLLNRRIATPSFQHNPIHRHLRTLHEERQQALPNDSGFFNVAGDRLLQVGKMAAANNKTVKLRIQEMSKQIPLTQQRAQFLSVLLPMADLKDALTQKGNLSKDSTNAQLFGEAKDALIKALEEDSEEETDADASVSSDGGELIGTTGDNSSGRVGATNKEDNFPTLVYPNRPASKEIMENRGIVKYRHKRERNPRVHLRYKYKKAQVRYKSRVPNLRKENKPYAGELRGIRVNMIKSHKFKRPT